MREMREIKGKESGKVVEKGGRVGEWHHPKIRMAGRRKGTTGEW